MKYSFLACEAFIIFLSPFLFLFTRILAIPHISPIPRSSALFDIMQVF